MVSPVLVVVAAMVSTITSWLVNGLPGIVKLFGNACGAVDVSGLAGKRWWLTASFKPLRQ